MKKTPSSTEFKIEKGIPVPQHVHANRKYPFMDLSVGDSFFVKTTDLKKAHAVACSARINSKKSDKKFTAKQDSDGVRVWRIA